MEQRIKTYWKGSVIFREDDFEGCMYEIQNGSVDIYAKYGSEDQKHLTTLKAGQYFGEIGFSTILPRTATAVAAENDTQLAEITTANFASHFSDNPLAVLSIVRSMNLRIRELSKDYRQAKQLIRDTVESDQKDAAQKAGLFSKLRGLVNEYNNPGFFKKSEPFDTDAFLESHRSSRRMVKEFYKGDVIFGGEDSIPCIYDIHCGTVGIYEDYGTPEETLLVELGSEQFFGKMGLVQEMPHSACAVALENKTEIQIFPATVFSDYLKERPDKIILTIMRLSGRIRELTNDYMDVCRTVADSYGTDLSGENDPQAVLEHLRRTSSRR